MPLSTLAMSIQKHDRSWSRSINRHASREDAAILTSRHSGLAGSGVVSISASSPSQMTSTFLFLKRTAIEAMLGQGELRLRIFREDRNVVVEIGDNGPGIPPEIEPHIFDPFFTTKGIGEGTGLGLNTVRTTVRKHGGSVHVHTRPGDTRFQVWLPSVDPSEPDLPTG